MALPNYKRTHTCGALRISESEQTVRLSGWVHRRRDHGNLIFIDLRDRFGITQLVFDPLIEASSHYLAQSLRSEWVITIEGRVRPRAPGMHNPKMATGEIEIEILKLDILSKAQTPPFSIADEHIDVSEDIRLQYRYLDIRRGQVAKALVVRNQALSLMRNYMHQQGFLEIATPIFTRSTPEGARDYLIPSRVHPGNFYALPQSPQILKQILMVAGMDRYFQIAPCFRDEDLRADRQPEFYQLDLEMSFTPREDLFTTIEGLLKQLFETVLSIQVPLPFPRLTHAQCLELYGSDKPDIRFAMPLTRIDDIIARSDFTILKEKLSLEGVVKAICVKGSATDISRKKLDDYTQFVKNFGIDGLACAKLQEEGLASNIVKFFSPELQVELISRLGMETGDTILIAAGPQDRVNQGLDHLRRHIAKERNLIPADTYSFLWVIDFPMFQWNHEENRLEAEHHPFTAPLEEDMHLLDTEPLKARSSSYDIVLNGYELGSGSQRIYDSAMQQRIFQLLQLNDADIQEKFGFFIEALSYGTPPHMGIALGIERLMMLLNQTNNMRDVIAFPKNNRGVDVMMDAPSSVTLQQLRDLHIRLAGQALATPELNGMPLDGMP
jgi:aspartyl-tRNA synthetase